jgi:dTDP-N-acetylfucosamine:lipid II N-acetylfucosaminyltransferase
MHCAMPDHDPVRALHLFSDKKFLPWVRQTFSATDWTSSYIILNPQIKSSCVTVDDNTLEVSTDAYGRKKVMEKLAATEIAFHYFLDNVKADIICDADPRILHCWCFYGAEIYQQTNLFRNDIYGPATRRLLWSLPEIKFRYDLRKYYFMLFKRKQPPITSLRKAIPRIHRILWYVEEEIVKINTRIQLPPWQFFQFFSFADIVPPGTQPTNKESGKILIGNSATIENNHVDVLETLISHQNDQSTFSLPMTYGLFPRYKQIVKARFQKKLGTRVYFLEEHMKLEAYYHFLQQHPTAIFLHYRQQGLGNILYLLYTGTKVYLSRHNVIYQWLTRNQIKVYIFEDEFAADYKQHNLLLDDVTSVQNREGIVALLDHNRNKDTLRSLEAEVLRNRQNLTR